MKFSEIIGHEQIKFRLRRMADSNKIPHALLFEGPEGIGKLALARAFAQYIHCQNRHDGDSCGECPSCIQHQTFNQIDTFCIYPVYKKDSKKEITSDDFIDDWREFLSQNIYVSYGNWVKQLGSGTSQLVIYNSDGDNILRKVSRQTYSSRYRIMIMWLPEKMNKECANRLLKMIEEPYEDTILLFVSNNSGEILPTIYSRVQRLVVKKYPIELTASYLIGKHGINEQDALSIASLSDGSIIHAEEIYGESEEKAYYFDQFKRLMRSAYSRNLRDLRDWSDEIANLKREKCREFLEYMARMVRENYIYGYKEKSLVFMTKDETVFSSRFSPYINERNVTGIVKEIDKAAVDIARNANLKIVLFDLALKIVIAIRM